MNLNSIDTWFFESLSQSYPDKLSIILVEGIKADTPELVEVDEKTSVGPYFPVRVEGCSLCIEIIFEEVFSYQVVNESYSAPQSDFESDAFLGPVKKCSKLQYLTYLESDSILSQTRAGEYGSYYIWTEDQTFFVISGKAPEIKTHDQKANTSIERTATYFAK
jgi:hypothetical protein